MFKTTAALLFLSSVAPSALGHSFLEKVWVNGVEYAAWDPNAGSLGTPYPTNTPSWYTENVGGNPLKPVSANTRDIVCGKNSSNAQFSAPTDAGSELTAKWWQAGSPFPQSHWGPIIDYIAPCNGPCADVDPEALKFVKIAQKGWIDDSKWAEGYWATNEMVDNNGTHAIRVPSGLKAGEYVVRHELIALHVAFTSINQGPYYVDGAEFYPQCVSIKVGGSGTKEITGGKGAKKLYRGDEPGLAIDIHTTNNHSDYIMPGPPLWSGA